jgi:hypothetical protein
MWINRMRIGYMRVRCIRSSCRKKLWCVQYESYRKHLLIEWPKYTKIVEDAKLANELPIVLNDEAEKVDNLVDF